QRLLLNNRHRVRFTLGPDADLLEASKRLEQEQLGTIRSCLTDADKGGMLERRQALEARQAQEDGSVILSKVTIADVPPQVSYIAPTAQHPQGLPTTEYVVGTNGLLYQQLLADLPALNREQLTWLPFFTQAWTEVGAGGNDYLFQQQKQTATVGSLTAYASIKGAVDNCDELQGYLVMTGKALT